MSNYKGIKGFQIKTRTEDPAPFAQAKSDNPYAGSWASGGSMNTARDAATGAGIQTAAFVAGGRDPTTPIAFHEQYNGSSWTEAADLNTGRRYIMNAGTTTAGLAAGSNIPGSWSNVETWNGSSWTETTELNTGRGYAWRGGSTGTAVLIAG